MFRRPLAVFLYTFVLSTAAVWNCGGDDDDDSSPANGADCNTVANIGSDVTLNDTTDAIPTGTGGTFVNGTYVLTEFKTYTGSPMAGSGIVMKQTLQLNDGVGQMIGVDSSSGTYKKSFTYQTNGTTPTITTTCTTQNPNMDVPYSSYTATSSSFSLYSTTYGMSVTYTKQ